MKIKNILIISGILIVLLFGSYLIQTTYSKFKKNINSDTEVQIAGWNIKVNSESIINKSKLTANISPTFIGSSYVSPGVIAPGVEGYYDIVIDAGDVDVSFNYVILSTTSGDSTITDLVTTGYEINPSEGTNIMPYNIESGITGSIVHGTNSTIIRIYIKWDDSATANMDNIADTQAATNSSAKALMETNITFNQINN